MTIYCLNCNKEMNIRPSWVRQGRKNCSRECAATSLWSNPGHRNLMSESHKGKISGSKGKHWKVVDTSKMSHTAWNKGMKHPEFSGESHPNWIADRSKLAKTQQRNDPAYKEWRKSVRDRDGWMCKMSNGDCLGKVVAHHILPWAKFPGLRYETNNGITLCRFHHPRKREEEMKLSPYFQSLVMSNRN